MVLYVIIALAMAVLATVFALQNAVPVTVTVLRWKYESSLALVLLAALTTGAVIGLMSTMPALLKKKWAISSQRRRLKDLERDLNHQKETSV